LHFGRDDFHVVPDFSLGRGGTRPYRRFLCHAVSLRRGIGGVNSVLAYFAWFAFTSAMSVHNSRHHAPAIFRFLSAGFLFN
jgi:hypothetical protein